MTGIVRYKISSWIILIFVYSTVEGGVSVKVTVKECAVPAFEFKEKPTMIVPGLGVSHRKSGSVDHVSSVTWAEASTFIYIVFPFCSNLKQVSLILVGVAGVTIAQRRVP